MLDACHVLLEGGDICLSLPPQEPDRCGLGLEFGLGLSGDVLDRPARCQQALAGPPRPRLLAR
eukprot:7283016-Alexandrium_andersonii.AAC.1